MARRPVVTGTTKQPTTTTKGKPGKYAPPRRKKLAEFVMKQTATPKITLPREMRPVAVDPLDAQVDAQTQLQFGGAQAELERNARAIPEWFKAYQATVDKAAGENRAAAAAAQAQLAGLQGALTGLGTQQAQALGASEAASAATRGADAKTAGIGQTATDAGGVRRDLLGSFQALLTQQGVGQSARDAEQSRFAGGQQISALQANAAKRADLASQRGAYKTEARRKLIEDARKQALEEAVFGAELAQAGAKAEAAEGEVNQWGYTKAQWDQMTPAERLQAMREGKKATTITTPPDTGKVNQYGYTDAQWRAMTIAQRQKIIKDFKTSGKGKGKDKKSPWLNPAEQGKRADKIGQALHYAKEAKGQKLSRRDAAALLLAGQKGGKDAQSIPAIDALYASVALDIAYDGHISKANVKRLQARGIKVKSLGYKTPGTMPRRKPKAGALGSGAVQDVANAIGGAIR